MPPPLPPGAIPLPPGAVPLSADFSQQQSVPSFGERYWGTVKHQLNPINVASGMIDFAMHPIDTLKSGFTQESEMPARVPEPTGKLASIRRAMGGGPNAPSYRSAKADDLPELLGTATSIIALDRMVKPGIRAARTVAKVAGDSKVANKWKTAWQSTQPPPQSAPSKAPRPSPAWKSLPAPANEVSAVAEGPIPKPELRARTQNTKADRPPPAWKSLPAPETETPSITPEISAPSSLPSGRKVGGIENVDDAALERMAAERVARESATPNGESRPAPSSTGGSAKGSGPGGNTDINVKYRPAHLDELPESYVKLARQHAQRHRASEATIQRADIQTAEHLHKDNIDIARWDKMSRTEKAAAFSKAQEARIESGQLTKPKGEKGGNDWNRRTRLNNDAQAEQKLQRLRALLKAGITPP